MEGPYKGVLITVKKRLLYVNGVVELDPFSTNIIRCFSGTLKAHIIPEFSGVASCELEADEEFKL